MNRIGYIVNAFPVVSETFVLNEIRAMERGGVRVAIFPLSRRRDRVEHAAVADLRGPIVHPPPPGWRGLPRTALAHAAVLGRSPGAYLASLWRAVSRPRALAKRLERFALSVWIARCAVRYGVAHLHAHYAREPLEAAERVRRLIGVPYSFAAHAKDLYTSPDALLARRLRRARFAVACHAGGERRLRDLAGPEHAAKAIRVPHGVDTRVMRGHARGPERGKRERGSQGGPREGGLVLAVGRLTPKKGFDDLIAACAALRREGRAFRCVIVGEGRLKGTLRAAIDAAGLGDAVELHRFVPQEELARLYARASLLAAPSKIMEDGNRDGIPNVVVEAMCAGLPVVATRVGGIPEIVRDGVTGILVPPGDPEALARGIARLLEHPDEAGRMGRAAAGAARDLDFRRTNAPLVERFRAIADGPVRAALESVRDAAWRAGGLADQAAERLGRAPRRRPEVESAIARSVAPGLAANAWRPDLDRLAARRLWDEVYKSRRIALLAKGNGRHFDGGTVDGAGRDRLSVLDLGCGRGGLTVALDVGGHSVVGVDLRRRNCAVTRMRGRRYGSAPPVVVSRAERLPFADASFDFIYCMELLEHVADPEALLREVKRLLAPGGACAVTVVNRLAHRDPHYHLWGVNYLPRGLARRYIALRGRDKEAGRDAQALHEMHYFTRPRFVRMARSHGFEVIDPKAPGGGPRGLLHGLSRRASLGYNTDLLVLQAP